MTAPFEYPDVIEDIRATLPIEISSSRAILSTEFENGTESRRLLWNSVRRNIKINYSILEFAYANELRRFYERMNGSFHRFSFYLPQIEVYVDEFVGVLSSVTTVLNLPSKKAQGAPYVLYRDGAALTPGEWTFSAETGPDGEDQATLLYTPSIGESYHFDFTGRLRINARFSEQPLTFRDIKKYWSSTTVNLIGLEPYI